MQINENSSIKIDVNLNAMMKNFGEVFSGERIWIRELLQNARRAGATRINIYTDQSDPNYFRIDDNGSGVSDFQSLLTLGGSGWEPEVIERENPFGMGFYAALYAAVTVEIRSRGQRVVLHSGRILSGEPITLQPCEIRLGTSIILHLKKSIVEAGKENQIEKLKEYLEAIVYGFPVPVHLNAESLRRPYALDVWRGLRFELPEGVALVDLNLEDVFPTKGVTFLQGLVISSADNGLRTWPNFSRRGMQVYMHLHGDQWRVLVPDRNMLYESTETRERIRSLENGVVQAAANHIAAQGQDGSSLYPADDTLDHLFAMYAFGLPILDAWEDPEHWFSRASAGEEIEAFYNREVSASVQESDIVAEGAWWGKRVILCKRFSLSLEGFGIKEFTEDAFLNGAFWIIDRPLHWDYPIDQAFYFQTEGEDFDESGLDAAMENFRANLAIIKGDPGALIQSALQEYAQTLDGSRFVVEVKGGEIQVKELPVATNT